MINKEIQEERGKIYRYKTGEKYEEEKFDWKTVHHWSGCAWGGSVLFIAGGKGLGT